MEGKQDDFSSLIIRARSRFLRLPIQSDKLKVAMWIAKLSESTDLELKTRYAKLLVDMLERNVLLRPFIEDPPRTLVPLAQEFLSDGVVDILLEERDRQGGSGDRPPVFTEVSSDLKQYAAAQIIPKFGVHCYYAVSDEPMSQWRHAGDAPSEPKIESVPEPEEPKDTICGDERPDGEECASFVCGDLPSFVGEDDADFQWMDRLEAAVESFPVQSMADPTYREILKYTLPSPKDPNAEPASGRPKRNVNPGDLSPATVTRIVIPYLRAGLPIPKDLKSLVGQKPPIPAPQPATSTPAGSPHTPPSSYYSAVTPPSARSPVLPPPQAPSRRAPASPGWSSSSSQQSPASSLSPLAVPLPCPGSSISRSTASPARTPASSQPTQASTQYFSVTPPSLVSTLPSSGSPCPGSPQHVASSSQYQTSPSRSPASSARSPASPAQYFSESPPSLVSTIPSSKSPSRSPASPAWSAASPPPSQASTLSYSGSPCPGSSQYLASSSQYQTSPTRSPASSARSPASPAQYFSESPPSLVSSIPSSKSPSRSPASSSPQASSSQHFSGTPSPLQSTQPSSTSSSRSPGSPLRLPPPYQASTPKSPLSYSSTSRSPASTRSPPSSPGFSSTPPTLVSTISTPPSTPRSTPRSPVSPRSPPSPPVCPASYIIQPAVARDMDSYYMRQQMLREQMLSPIQEASREAYTLSPPRSGEQQHQEYAEEHGFAQSFSPLRSRSGQPPQSFVESSGSDFSLANLCIPTCANAPPRPQSSRSIPGYCIPACLDQQHRPQSQPSSPFAAQRSQRSRQNAPQESLLIDLTSQETSPRSVTPRPMTPRPMTPRSATPPPFVPPELDERVYEEFYEAMDPDDGKIREIARNMRRKCGEEEKKHKIYLERNRGPSPGPSQQTQSWQYESSTEAIKRTPSSHALPLTPIYSSASAKEARSKERVVCPDEERFLQPWKERTPPKRAFRTSTPSPPMPPPIWSSAPGSREKKVFPEEERFTRPAQKRIPPKRVVRSTPPTEPLPEPIYSSSRSNTSCRTSPVIMPGQERFYAPRQERTPPFSLSTSPLPEMPPPIYSSSARRREEEARRRERMANPEAYIPERFRNLPPQPMREQRCPAGSIAFDVAESFPPPSTLVSREERRFLPSVTSTPRAQRTPR